MTYLQICCWTSVKPTIKNQFHVLDSGMEEEMASLAHKRFQTEIEKSKLSKQDICLLLIVCTELVNLCVKLTGKIDPAAAAMLAYVRDDIQSESEAKLLKL